MPIGNSYVITVLCVVKCLALTVVVVIVLKDRRLLKQTQRLVAFYILVEVYRGEQPCTNPFLSFLIDVSAQRIFAWGTSIHSALGRKDEYEKAI